MHMADALISPAVGGIMLAATTGVGAYCVKKIQNEIDDKKTPLMGIMGAFVFACQMINFSIPGTGSSGHLGGGLILAIILGSNGGFLAMASILLIQALFFGDGGLLAYGCNVFNLGFYTCFIAYPLIYKKIISRNYSKKSIFIASTLSAVVGLQMGSFSVVLETLFSGKTELTFWTFVLMMQPIHLAIGIVEGLVTTAVVSFVWKARPEIIEVADKGNVIGVISIKKVFRVTVVAVVLLGGIFSWFASSNPDGLEWSMLKTSGKEKLVVAGGIYEAISGIQNKTVILPDYNFKQEEMDKESSMTNISDKKKEDTSVIKPLVNSGTSLSGLLGAIFTFGLTIFIGFIIKIIKRRKRVDSNYV